MSEKDCEHFQEGIVDAFSGELMPEKRAELDAHLKSCAHCSATWEDYQSLRRGMQFLEKQEQPSELTRARILKAAQTNSPAAQKKPAGIWKFLLSPPTMAAAMVALLIGVGLYSQKWLERQPLHTTIPGPPPAELKDFDTGTMPASAPSAPAAAAPAGRLEEAEKPPAAEGGAKKAKTPAANLSAPPPAKNAFEKIPEAENHLVPLSAPLPATTTSGPGMGAGSLGVEPAKESQPPPPSSIQKSLQQAPAAPAQGLLKGEENFGGVRSKSVPAPGAAEDLREQDKAAEEQAQTKDEKKKASKEVKPAADAAAKSELDLLNRNTKQQEAQSPLMEKEKSTAPSGEKLLTQAKAKIKAGKYGDALQDLLQAQKISDDPEIPSLIELCRNKMKPEPVVPAK